jgi:hypothetical protein
MASAAPSSLSTSSATIIGPNGASGRRQSHVKPTSGWQVRHDYLPERVFIKIKFQEGTGNLNYSATSGAVPR